jgi:hypothetical protein
MSEYQYLINIALGAAFALGGWFARTLWDAVQELKGDLSNLRVEIAKDYTPRNDFKEFAVEIRTMFQKISDKLDNKADK